MKKIFTILAVLIYLLTYFNVPAQTYNGAFYEMFFGSEPSARAEEKYMMSFIRRNIKRCSS